MINNYILPILIIALFIFAMIKKVNVYNSFTVGIKSAITLIFDIFPYICVVLIMVKLLTKSGLLQLIIDLLTPFCNFLGIDASLIPLIIIKPFSGSGSLAILDEIFTNFGVDSLTSKTASVIFGSSETVFYVAGIYFGKNGSKSNKKPILIALFTTFFASIFACVICKIL